MLEYPYSHKYAVDCVECAERVENTGIPQLAVCPTDPAHTLVMGSIAFGPIVGLICQSPDGTKYVVGVDDSGARTSTAL